MKSSKTVEKKPAKRLGPRLAAGAAITAIAITFVGGHEGLRLKAYKDPVGIPTICFGETKGVRMGDVKTREQCDALLIESLQAHAERMEACLKDPDALPDLTYVAFSSFAYNVGTGAFCKSTLAKRVNEGNLTAACDELLKWNKAGGKVLPGLTRRRQEERQMCREGLGLK